MKAVVYRRYGPPEVARLEDLDDPIPGDGELRVRIHASVVSAADRAFRSGKPFSARLFLGPTRPRLTVLGSVFAGAVDAVGAGVSRFRPGDLVVGVAGPRLGAHAEYICLPQTAALAPKPANLSHEEAVAACEGALTALPFLRDEAGLRSGQSIIINGAAGAVGSAGVQLARHMGAQVTAVCSATKADLMRGLGADAVIDYTTEDFTRLGATYDVVFDAVGTSSFGRCRRILRPGGIYLTTVPSLAIFAQQLWTKLGRRRAGIAFTGMRAVTRVADDLRLLTELAQTGHLRPVIDGRYPFDRVADAYRRVETGHKSGSVVLTATSGEAS